MFGGDCIQACDVITEHFEDGKIIPLKFRIHEGDESHVFIIKSFVELPQIHNQKGLKKFRCKIIVNDAIRECDLTFYKDMTKWVLDKIK